MEPSIFKFGELPDFKKLTRKFDIFSLVETHSNEQSDLSIDGFSIPFQRHRPTKKGKKAFGGIAVYIKNEILHC